MKKINIYLAGPIFSIGDLTMRKFYKQKIDEFFNEEAIKNKFIANIYNPIDFNKTIDIKKMSEFELNRIIFNKDYEQLINSDVVIVDIDGLDSGTLMELGIAFGLKKKIFVVYTNWKAYKNKLSDSINNKFVAGMISGIGYAKNIELLISELRMWLVKKDFEENICE